MTSPDNLVLFFSRATQARLARDDRLHDAVLDLANLIEALAETDSERRELASEACWLLNEVMTDFPPKVTA